MNLPTFATFYFVGILLGVILLIMLAELRRVLIRRNEHNALRVWQRKNDQQFAAVQRSAKALGLPTDELDDLMVQIRAVHLITVVLGPRIFAMNLTPEQTDATLKATMIMMEDGKELEAFGAFAQIAGITQNTLTEQEFIQLMELDQKMGALFYAQLAKPQEVKSG